LSDDVPVNFLNLIHKKTEGNPLYIEEIIKSLLESNIIDLDTKDGWDEKKNLAVAVLLQSILKACRPMVIGSSFLDIRELAGEYRSDLEKISFFEYMEHANEFSV